ncbi:MAG: YggT family protein [Pontibacterium sp.]
MGSDPILFLIQTIGQMYAFIVVMRFILQLSQADYYNPISQAVVKLSNPPLRPLQKLLPRFNRVDVAALILAIAVKALTIVLILAYQGATPSAVSLLIPPAFGVLDTILTIYFWAVLGSVIISWVAPDSYHPGPELIKQITQPLFSLAQRVIPPIGGLDLSPILIFIVIQLIQSQIRHLAF